MSADLPRAESPAGMDSPVPEAAVPETAAPESAAPEAAAPESAAPELPLLAAPRDGVPPVLTEERELMAACAALAAHPGPVAIDAERASGYRYGQGAYLVQVRREGAGTFLFDPVALPDLSPLDAVLADSEWVIHAATQDIPCLGELGLHPRRLFDTELGSRLAGLPRAGLSAVIEHYLGVRLAKEHSAVDWSTRPLPQEWLSYAALDVELLVAVRNAMEEDLAAQGKLEWALEEFDALTRFTGPAPKAERWRRTSGLHKIRAPKALAVVRALWTTREEIARTRDTSPGRVLPDAMIVEFALKAPAGTAELAKVASSNGRRPHPGVARHQREWLSAINRALELPRQQLPQPAPRSEGPPPPRAWRDRDPVAAARLSNARAALSALSDRLGIPPENLLSPDSLRRVLWSPPGEDDEAIAHALREHGARGWQIELTTPILRDALRITQPADPPEAPAE